VRMYDFHVTDDNLVIILRRRGLHPGRPLLPLFQRLPGAHFHFLVLLLVVLQVKILPSTHDPASAPAGPHASCLSSERRDALCYNDLTADGRDESD